MIPAVDKKERRAVRTKREQLLTLVNGWDPLGLLAAGAPRDKYDCVIDKLLSLLSQRAGKEDIARSLDDDIREHFGRTPEGSAQFVNRAVTWFEIESADEPDASH